MSAPKNPPAFPRTGEGVGSPQYDVPGMTLRDWFAGQALASVMQTAENMGEATPEQRAQIWAAVACHMYEMADAMLAARENGK